MTRSSASTRTARPSSIKAGREFEILRTNDLAEDDMCMATPAIVGDKVLLRTAARMYCLKKGAKLKDEARTK